MAARYDQKKKDEVVSFIQNYNQENGRGGQSAAVKKFSINPITLKSWMEKAGLETPGKTAKKRKSKVSASVGTRGGRTAPPTTKSATLKRMVTVQEQIEALNAEYEALKAAL